MNIDFGCPNEAFHSFAFIGASPEVAPSSRFLVILTEYKFLLILLRTSVYADERVTNPVLMILFIAVTKSNADFEKRENNPLNIIINCWVWDL